MALFTGLISWVLFGLAAGVVAWLLTPRREAVGCILNVLLGVAGAVIGGLLATWLDFAGLAEWDWRGFVVAALACLMLLALFRLVAEGKPGSER